MRVTLNDLMAMWKKDSDIDETEPGRELLKIPKLHAKYLEILIDHNLILENLDIEYNKLLKTKREYYAGDLNNTQDLAAHNLTPMMKKILRQDIPTYTDADEDLGNILARKSINKQIISACDRILKECHSRTFQLKSYVEWRKFSDGG